MKTRVALIACCGLFVASNLVGDNTKDNANARDQKKLQGKWTSVWWVEGGTKYRCAVHGLIPSAVFKGDVVTFLGVAGGKVVIKRKGHFKLDTTSVPYSIDITTLEIAHAIYAIEGDTLKLCFPLPEPEASRPREFTSTAENGNTLILFKRSK